MPYNPCGRVVDMGRRPYSTMAKFFKDSDQAVKIKWYKADDDAPVLGFPSSINSLDMRTYPWMPYPLGEVFGAERTYNAQWTPPAETDYQVCGTEEQFIHGATYNPPGNNLYIPALSIPQCCVCKALTPSTPCADAVQLDFDDPVTICAGRFPEHVYWFVNVPGFTEVCHYVIDWAGAPTVAPQTTQSTGFGSCAVNIMSSEQVIFPNPAKVICVVEPLPTRRFLLLRMRSAVNLQWIRVTLKHGMPT